MFTCDKEEHHMGTLKNIHLRKRAVGVNFGVNLVWGWTESFHPEQLMS